MDEQNSFVFRLISKRRWGSGRRQVGGQVVVPHNDGVTESARPLQTSRRDDHGALCRNRHVIGMLKRARCRCRRQGSMSQLSRAGVKDRGRITAIGRVTRRCIPGHHWTCVTIPGLASRIAASTAGMSGRSTVPSLLGAWRTITASRTPAKFADIRDCDQR